MFLFGQVVCVEMILRRVELFCFDTNPIQATQINYKQNVGVVHNYLSYLAGLPTCVVRFLLHVWSLTFLHH